MKRILCLLLALLTLTLTPAALAGNDSDPLIDTGVYADAIAGTPWAASRFYHMYNIYHAEKEQTFAIFYDDYQRVLLQCDYDAGKSRWFLHFEYHDLLCQGAYCTSFVNMDDEIPGRLVLTHSSEDLTEFFYFRREDRSESPYFRAGDTWLLDEVRLYTPLAGYTGDPATPPQRVARATYSGDTLTYTFYNEDLYGVLPDKKIPSPGNGAWVETALPAYSVQTAPVTLDTFTVAAFPRDPDTQQYYLSLAACQQRLGQIDDDRRAVVNNPNPKDRLNLRSEMSTQSEYLGKYYTGAEVTLFEGGNDEWAHVFVGNNTIGYMLRKYLATGDAADAVQSAMPTYKMPARAWQLLYLPFDDSNVKETFPGGETIEVMGIVSGWWHIIVQGQRGYIRQLEDLH